jgi:hypothetical protein
MWKRLQQEFATNSPAIVSQWIVPVHVQIALMMLVNVRVTIN